MAEYTSASEKDEVNTEGEAEEYGEFTSEIDMDPAEKLALTTKLDNMFTYAADNQSWIRGRDMMIKTFQYREGEQWTEAEKKELAKRHQPDTVNNQISVVVNRLVGDLVNQKFRVGYVGRNAPMDEGIADVLSQIQMYVRQSNDLEFEERDMAEDGFTCGLGVLDVSVEFDDMYQPEIKVRHEDPLIVFPDPDSREYDWNKDARFIARAKWYNLDEVVELYPQAEADLKAVGSGVATFGDMSNSAQLANVDKFKGEKYIDRKNNRVRLIEVQYKKYERMQIVILSDGTSAPLPEGTNVKGILKQAKAKGLKARLIEKLNTTICVGLYAAGILLEHKETDHKYYSLVPYWAYRRKTGEPYSLISLALSMQDAINKRESKALHLLNTNQAIYEKSAVDDPQKIAEEKAKPDGMIELRDGALSQQRFQLKENLELAASQFNMHQRAQGDLYSIVGLDQRMGQQTGEIRSGKGLQQKYAEASKPVATLFDNVRRTRKLFSRVILDYVQKYYTGEKLFLITDNQGVASQVGVSADQMEKIKTGLYDAIVTDFEDDDSVQDEHFRIIAETLPQILQFPPVYAGLLVSMSRIKDKDKVMAAIQQQSQAAPLMPKMNLQANLDALDPVERAGIWQLVGKPEIAQHIIQSNPSTPQQLKSSTELAKEKLKQGDPVAQQQQAAMDAQQAAQQHQHEMDAMQAEHDMKMQQMMAKHHVDMQKHQANMQATMLKAATAQQKGAQ